MTGQYRKEGSVSGNSEATSSRARTASWVGQPVVVVVVVVVLVVVVVVVVVVVLVVVVVVVNVQRSIL